MLWKGKQGKDDPNGRIPSFAKYRSSAVAQSLLAQEYVNTLI